MSQDVQVGNVPIGSDKSYVILTINGMERPEVEFRATIYHPFTCTNLGDGPRIEATGHVETWVALYAEDGKVLRLEPHDVVEFRHATHAEQGGSILCFRITGVGLDTLALRQHFHEVEARLGAVVMDHSDLTPNRFWQQIERIPYEDKKQVN